MTFYSALVPIHILFGSLSLMSFPIPMLARKGGSLHRNSGWVYVAGMLGVAVTALLIACWRIFFDPEPTSEKTAFALFLVMIAIFTSSAMWSGIRVLKFKNRTEKHIVALDFYVYWLRISSALAISIYGFIIHNSLLSWFSIILIFSGIQGILYWRSPQKQKMHWWFHHIEAMFTACIGTVTAFVVTAVPRMLGGYDHALALWLSPAVVFIPIRMWSERKYKRQFKIND